MSSSPNGARHSSGSSQCQLKHAHREIESYKDNVLELQKLFHSSPALFATHPDIADEVDKTITETYRVLEEAEVLVDKDMSRLRRWVGKAVSSLRPPLKDYENLKQTMEDNNRCVKRLSRKIKAIAELEPEHEHGRLSFELFNPLIHAEPPIERTIPFTEPYDEDLCELETVDS